MAAPLWRTSSRHPQIPASGLPRGHSRGRALQPDGRGLIDRGVPVRVELEIDVRWTPEDAPRGFNIVGDLPGTDKADEIVLVGAHFDSFHGATGATDNAAGVTAMMEALRVIRAAGLAPRRTIRLGCGATRRAARRLAKPTRRRHLGTHAEPQPELAKLSAYFNLDNGTGRIRGVWSQGNAAARQIFEAWSAPLKDLGVDLISSAVGGAERSPAVRSRRRARVSSSSRSGTSTVRARTTRTWTSSIACRWTT